MQIMHSEKLDGMPRCLLTEFYYGAAATLRHLYMNVFSVSKH